MKSKTPIPDLVSMLDPARPSHQWLQRTILRARAYLDLIPDCPEAAHLRRVIHWATHAERAIEQGDAIGAATAAMGAIQAAWQAELVQGRVVVADGFKKRSGDKNRAEKVIRGRKKQVDETSERHRKIYADFIKVMNERPSASKRVIYEKLGREYDLAWGRIRNIVSEQKKGR